MKRNIFHSKELQEAFKEKGYIKTSFSKPDLLLKLKEKIAQLKPDDQFDPVNHKVMPVADLSMHCTFFDTNVHYKQEAYALFMSYFSEEVTRVLVDYSIMGGNIFVKQPGSAPMNIHQHWLFADYTHTCLSIWIPLQDVDASNGALQVVEGSHKIVNYIPSPFQPDYFLSFEKELREKHLTTLQVNLGEAIIFCDSLLHGSPSNTSGDPRFAIQLDLYPSECTPVHYHYEKEKDVFDIYTIRSTFFIENSIDAAFHPPVNETRLGSVPNNNKPLNYEEFQFRMKEGPAVRQMLYSGEPIHVASFPPLSSPEEKVTIEFPLKPSLWQRVKGFFSQS